MPKASYEYKTELEDNIKERNHEGFLAVLKEADAENALLSFSEVVGLLNHAEHVVFKKTSSGSYVPDGFCAFSEKLVLQEKNEFLQLTRTFYLRKMHANNISQADVEGLLKSFLLANDTHAVLHVLDSTLGKPFAPSVALAGNAWALCHKEVYDKKLTDFFSHHTASSKKLAASAPVGEVRISDSSDDESANSALTT